MKKLLFIAVFLIGWVSSVLAEKIASYEVNFTVEQSGELSIIESIEYDFEQEQKHGIYRDIPFMVEGERRPKDIGLYDFSVQLDGSNVQWEKSIMGSMQAGDVIRLKIGSADTYLSGKHTYKISYRVKKGVLPAAQNNDNDAIRWNIIGTGWGIPIYNIKAYIFLPNSLSKQDVTLSTFTGAYGAITSQADSSWINPHNLVISASFLKPHEGLTIELAYPANRLDQHGLDNVEGTFWDWILDYWQWGALIGFVLYFKKIFEQNTGFVDKRSIAVQYNPPKGLSLLQSGLVLDKFADNEDFAAAVLELAELGYIQIEQKSKQNDPILIRTEKPIDQNLSEDQKYLLSEILFKTGKSYTFSAGSQTKAQSLQNGFVHVNDQLYTWVASAGYMSENPQKIRNGFLLKSILYLLPVLGLAFYTLMQKYGVDILFFMIFPLIFGGVGIGVFLGSKVWIQKLGGVIFLLAGVGSLLALIQGTKLSLIGILTGPFGVFLILVVLMIFVYKKIGKFTQHGAQARTHLLGLEMFVKRVKQDEIKRRLEADPLYLEKMLPYAVLFGETEHWLAFFTILNVAAPYWYHGNIQHLGGFSSSVRSASMSPSSSGGSGFGGGGGFSGGGGGGGGGGSW